MAEVSFIQNAAYATVWSSLAEYDLKFYTDDTQTEDYHMTGKGIQIIGKKRLSDSDANAIFQKSEGSELEIDAVDDSIVHFTLLPDDTATLTRTKSTSLYVEFLVTVPIRQTLMQFMIPVYPSIAELSGS